MKTGQLLKLIHSSAATILGHLSCIHQNWFDKKNEEIKSLVEEKTTTLLAQGTSR